MGEALRVWGRHLAAAGGLAQLLELPDKMGRGLGHRSVLHRHQMECGHEVWTYDG